MPEIDDLNIRRSDVEVAGQLSQQVASSPHNKDVRGAAMCAEFLDLTMDPILAVWL